MLVALYVSWLLLSGIFTPFLMLAGLGCALAVSWFVRRMDAVDHKGRRAYPAANVLLYWPWLFKEIVKSAWAVSRIIVHPKLPISPTLVRFRPSQRTEMGLVVHANSITLTPGTIAVEVSPDEFLVHGITHASAHGTVASEMDRRVTACEGRA